MKRHPANTKEHMPNVSMFDLMLQPPNHIYISAKFAVYCIFRFQIVAHNRKHIKKTLEYYRV